MTTTCPQHKAGGAVRQVWQWQRQGYPGRSQLGSEQSSVQAAVCQPQSPPFHVPLAWRRLLWCFGAASRGCCLCCSTLTLQKPFRAWGLTTQEFSSQLAGTRSHCQDLHLALMKPPGGLDQRVLRLRPGLFLPRWHFGSSRACIYQCPRHLLRTG